MVNMGAAKDVRLCFSFSRTDTLMISTNCLLTVITNARLLKIFG